MNSTDVCKSVLHPFKSLHFFLYVVRSKFYCIAFSSSVKNEPITLHHLTSEALLAALFSHINRCPTLSSHCPSGAGTTSGGCAGSFLSVSGNCNNFKYLPLELEQLLFSQGRTSLCLGTGSSPGLPGWRPVTRAFASCAVVLGTLSLAEALWPPHLFLQGLSSGAAEVPGLCSVLQMCWCRAWGL